jgi:RNA polymerase sigma-70 factor, ECF subfamily
VSSEDATPVSDEALVRRLRAGDDRAGDELAARHCASLMRYLQRLVRSDHLAEELHQQTWTSTLEHLDRFDTSSSGGGFKAWLYRIATNKAHDLWRARGREKSVKQSLTLITEESGPDASHRLEGAEAETSLRAAIESLPENQKQILLLRYYANLKFVEIAEMLGCPLNTALGRMHKAMIHLRKLLADPLSDQTHGAGAQDVESRIS